MLQQITNYLIRKKKVSIPEIGTFYIKPVPSYWEQEGKMLAAPTYITEYVAEDHVPEDQACELSSDFAIEREEFGKRFQAFGKQLKRFLEGKSFNWQGIGTIQVKEGIVGFEAQPVTPVLSAIEIPARASLITEQFTLNTPEEVQKEHTEIETFRNKVYIIGWILFIFLIAFIIYLLYKSDFNIAATGLRSHPLHNGFTFN